MFYTMSFPFWSKKIFFQTAMECVLFCFFPLCLSHRANGYLKLTFEILRCNNVIHWGGRQQWCIRNKSSSPKRHSQTGYRIGKQALREGHIFSTLPSRSVAQVRTGHLVTLSLVDNHLSVFPSLWKYHTLFLKTQHHTYREKSALSSFNKSWILSLLCRED